MRISIRAWAGLSGLVAMVMVVSEVAVVGVGSATGPTYVQAPSPVVADFNQKTVAQPLSSTLPEFPDNLTHFVLILRENHVFDDYLGDCSLNINNTCNGGISYSSTSSGTATETSPSGNQLLTPNTHALAREYAVFDNMYSSVDPYSAQGHNYLFTANVWGGSDSGTGCSNWVVEGTGSNTEWGNYNSSEVKAGSCGWSPDLGSQTYNSAGGSIFDRFLGPHVPQSKTTLPFLADGDNVWELASPGCTVTASKTIPGDALNSVQVVTGCTNGYWLNSSSGSPGMPPTVNPTTGIPQFLWECQFASGCGSTAPSTFLDSYAADSFTAFLADYGLPTYTEVELQDDHPGSYCGQSESICIQWNDAAVNTVVSAIENSTTYSKNTVIAITEDDTQDGQNGMDHVNNGRRLPFVLVAPHSVMKSGGAPLTCGISNTYPSCGLVIHPTFNFSNVLAVMERVEMNVNPGVFLTGGISPNSAAFPMVQNDYLAEGDPLEPAWKCGQPGVPCNTGATGGLAVGSFTASPSTIPLGGTTYLNVSASGGTSPYTYAYTGLPAGCTSANQPKILCTPSAVGGSTVTVTVSDSASATATGSTTFTVTSGSSLAITSFTASPTTIPLGGTLYLNTTATGGTLPYTYVFNNLPAGCSSSNVASLPCAPSTAGTYSTVTGTVTDASSQSVTSRAVTFVVTSTSTLAIPSFTASPSRILLGGTTYLNVTVTGGTAPYSYAYIGLPTGCTSANSANLVCTPTVTGNRSVTVTVSDSASHSVAGTAAFTVTSVAGAPSIGAFTALPATLYVGDTLYVNTTATGGTPPYTYAYTGLPAGCTSSSTATYTCQPTSPGTSSISVTVTDAGSLSTTSSPASVAVYSLPSISAFTVLPATIPLGGTAYVNTSVSGGVAPYTYAFSGLPSGTGCTSTGPAFLCVPGAAGAYTVQATVTDSGGRAVTSPPLTLHVTPTTAPLTILSFTASPSPIPEGGTIYVNLSATGGSAPYAYAYSGLPSGCTSSNAARLLCVPSTTGAFSVTATVTDSASSTVMQVVTFVVTGGAPAQASSSTPWLEYAAVGAIAILAAALLIILATRKKGRPPVPVYQDHPQSYAPAQARPPW